jgi:hypothetical protein
MLWQPADFLPECLHSSIGALHLARQGAGRGSARSRSTEKVPPSGPTVQTVNWPLLTLLLFVAVPLGPASCMRCCRRQLRARTASCPRKGLGACLEALPAQCRQVIR